METKDRLQKILTDKKITISELSCRIAAENGAVVPYVTLNAWLRGIRVPRQEKIDQLLRGIE